MQMAIYEQRIFLFHTVHLLLFHGKENLMTEMATGVGVYERHLPLCKQHSNPAGSGNTREHRRYW